MAEQISSDARKASNVIKTLSNDKRTAALKVVHDLLRDNRDPIIAANKLDLDAAKEAGLPDSLIKRLDLTKGDKYDAMLQGILDVAALPDPLGKIQLAKHLDDGLDLYRLSCPLGVLLVIFEARPEVIANISALAIKSGNAAILKGGKESKNTFAAMADAVQRALGKTDIPSLAIQLVSSREEVGDLLKQDENIDLVVPRGSNELVRNIKNSTKIPVLGHADGICSVYIHETADPKMAARIVVDGKTNYPAACNAVETVLFDTKALDTCLVPVVKALKEAGVAVRASGAIKKALLEKSGEAGVADATDEDFYTEFLSLELAAKTVDSVQEAIDHINTHGSHHTDVIVTSTESAAEKFLKGVDSAGVYWNASSRFADGFRYGFGTEVGVSTNRIHARGPVGLEGLTTYQYQIRGHGQIAGDYLGAGGSRAFKHEEFDPSA